MVNSGSPWLFHDPSGFTFFNMVKGGSDFTMRELHNTVVIAKPSQVYQDYSWLFENTALHMTQCNAKLPMHQRQVLPLLSIKIPSLFSAFGSALAAHSRRTSYARRLAEVIQN